MMTIAIDIPKKCPRNIYRHTYISVDIFLKLRSLINVGRIANLVRNFALYSDFVIQFCTVSSLK